MNKFFLLFCLFLLFSCSKEVSTHYVARVINKTDKDLIVEFESVTQADTFVILKPCDIENASCYVEVFEYQYSTGNMPELADWEFKERIKKLNIYYLVNSDTIYLKQNPDYFLDIDIWSYEKSCDYFMLDCDALHQYTLTLE